jgi:hypothetical protein
MDLKTLIAGYEEWITRFLKDYWQVYYITFQFNHLSSNQKVAQELMKKEIERFYATLLTNVVRRPKHPCNNPQLIGFPDKPVAKRKSTYRLDDIVPNSGLHVHCIVTIPPGSRLKESLDDHINAHEPRYVGSHGKIQSLHVERIRELKGRLIDYTFKHIKRHTFTTDDILIYPKASSELQTAG